MLPERERAACSSRWSWDIFLSVFQSPKGEQRIAQAFRPGSHMYNEIALQGRPSGSLSMNVAFWESCFAVGRPFRANLSAMFSQG